MSRPCFSEASARTLLRLAALAWTTVAAATPAATVPARDAIVERQLLPASVKASLRELSATAGAPKDSAHRLAEARRLIVAGRVSGDPRLLGYAEAMLAPWPPQAAATPADALILHATIRQSRHEFDAARLLLDRVLAIDPANAQALLTRATIAQVQGNFKAARRDCAALHETAPAAAAVCTASVDAATGDDAAALNRLSAVAARAPELRGWALAIAGDIRLQRAEYAAAATLFRLSLAEGEDLQTRVALADALLAQGDHMAALAALAEAPDVDAVLLRRWLALRAGAGASGAVAGVQAGARAGAQAAELRQTLAARFAAARTRGDLPHGREETLFALAEGRHGDALAAARDNWRAQREATDLFLLARAAQAAGNQEVLAEAARWQQQSGLADARLRVVLEAKR